MMIIDRATVLLGSCNLTGNGFINNVEHMVRFNDPETVAEANASFDYWIKECNELTEKDLTQTMELDEGRKTAKMLSTMGHTFSEAYVKQTAITEFADALRRKEKDEVHYPEEDLKITELQRLQFEEDEEYSRLPVNPEEEWNPTITRKS